VAKEIRLTPERKAKLEEELQYLKTVRTDEVAQALKEARSQGDLSENSEYDAAKEEQGKLYSRIAEVEAVLANAVIIEEEYDGDHAHMGSVVTLIDEDGEEEVYTIVGTEEANPLSGKISDESPIGRAIVGKNVGDAVIVDAPSGQFRYKVKSIKN